MSRFVLTKRQRQLFQMQLKKTDNTEICRRIFALLAFDQGSSIEYIAKILKVARRTIYYWIGRFQRKRSLESLVHRAGQGRPRLLSKQQCRMIRSALKISPQKLGYAATQWTIPIIQDYLFQKTHIALSQYTIRRLLHSWGYVWKRFRYALPKDPEVEKKKSNFANDSHPAFRLCCSCYRRNGYQIASDLALGMGIERS